MSKAPGAKRQPRVAGVRRAVARGMVGAHPIDEHGVQVLQIQDLARRVDRLYAAVMAKIQKARA